MSTVEYFDGLSTASVPMLATIGRDALILRDPEGGEAMTWPFATLHRLPGSAIESDVLRIGPAGSDARVVIRDRGTIIRLRASHPGIDRPPPRPRGTLRRVVVLGVTALAAVWFIVFVAAPALAVRLAETMPAAREAALGNRVMTVIDRTGLMGRRCTAPAGLAALDTLVARLTDGLEPRLPLEIEVRSSGMVNAFALPGGRIVVLRGLLEGVEEVNAVAGVLAHEIGHVENRDAVREALRRAGSAAAIGLVFGDVLGVGAIGVMADGVFNASYTRDAERAADEFAARRLAAADVSTDDLADFMENMGSFAPQNMEAILSYLSSHPGGRERAAALRAADGGNDRPILSPAQWASLRSVCEELDEGDG